jgi:hypothetical protein
VVYRDVTRQAKGLYRLKHIGALGSGLAYLSRYNSGWFCHKIHDLILEIDDAHAHIDELQQQPIPSAVPIVPEGGEEDPEEIEGVFDLDSEHGGPEPNPQPDYSSSGSQSSVGDLDDF